MTISCSDTDGIPKVPDAGRVVDSPNGRVQIMHNGIRVVAGGYHGGWMSHVIRALRGHHEPQEELIFSHLLRYVRHDSLIVELGAFWAYYSLWYVSEVPGTRAVCIEPDPLHLDIGQKNARLNSLDDRLEFHSAWVGGTSSDAVTLPTESSEDVTLPCLDMNATFALCKHQFIELLHLDIQGAELPFLRSIDFDNIRNRVRLMFVSTHHSSISGSKSTHQDCVSTIVNGGGTIICEHDVQESFSGDGLIVASFFPQDAQLVLPSISRNTSRRSLFPEP